MSNQTLIGTFNHLQISIYANLKDIDFINKMDDYYRLCVIASILEYRGILTDNHNISWARHINKLKKYMERYDDSSYEKLKDDFNSDDDDDDESDAGNDGLNLRELVVAHGAGISPYFRNMFNNLSDEALLDWYSHYFGPTGLFLQFERYPQYYQISSFDELDTLLYVLTNKRLISYTTFNNWMMRIDRLEHRHDDIYEN